MLLLLTLTVPALAYDDETGAYDAASKARQAHELASSDMIYQQEEWKALYYQNIQIIDLLKDIRDSLQVIKAKGGMKNTEDVSS